MSQGTQYLKTEKGPIRHGRPRMLQLLPLTVVSVDDTGVGGLVPPPSPSPYPLTDDTLRTETTPGLEGDRQRPPRPSLRVLTGLRVVPRLTTFLVTTIRILPTGPSPRGERPDGG